VTAVQPRLLALAPAASIPLKSVEKIFFNNNNQTLVLKTKNKNGKMEKFIRENFPE